MMLKNFNGDLLEYSLRFGLSTSNNKAKYKALIVELDLARKFGATSLKIFRDSQLIINHVNRFCATKDPTMAAYLQKFKKLLVLFEKIELKLLSREENSHADALANIASTVHLEGKRSILVEYLEEISITCAICASVADEEET